MNNLKNVKSSVNLAAITVYFIVIPNNASLLWDYSLYIDFNVKIHLNGVG